MPEIIQIDEVQDRSTQGATLPFLCRGEDGFSYFVKGHAAGKECLLKEWVCGQLAVAFGLNIAPFSLVEVPSALVRPTIRHDIQELGAGVWFGSRFVPHVQEFTLSNREALLEHDDLCDTARDVFLFDWWVCNTDRTLSGYGGNPNLLWDYQSNQLVVIDHNLAFDAADATLDKYRSHVFFDAGHRYLTGDLFAAREVYFPRMAAAIDVYEDACDNAPPEWWEYAPGVPTNFNRHAVRHMLSRFESETFWEGPL